MGGEQVRQTPDAPAGAGRYVPLGHCVCRKAPPGAAGFLL